MNKSLKTKFNGENSLYIKTIKQSMYRKIDTRNIRIHTYTYTDINTRMHAYTTHMDVEAEEQQMKQRIRRRFSDITREPKLGQHIYICTPPPPLTLLRSANFHVLYIYTNIRVICNIGALKPEYSPE